MGIYFSSWRMALCVLLLLMFVKGRSARKMAHIQWKELNDNKNDLQHPIIDDDKKHTHAHPSSQMEDMDPSAKIFFSINDLKVRKTIPIYFSTEDPSTSPRLLPREEANSIPFSSARLPYLLEFFSFSKQCPQAQAMEYTLTQCELEPMQGETKFCATSLESMLDFAWDILGLDTQLKALTTNHLKKPTAPLQNYTILEKPKEILAQKILACHTMPYPYVVYYCHTPAGGNRLFEILLRGEHGEKVQATGICHMDTSQWDPNDTAFRVLKIKPGSSPVCHILPADNIVWVPLSA